MTWDQENPNELTAEQIEGIKKSFIKFGNVDPILIDQNNFIVHGNHRALVYKQLGMEAIPCYRRTFKDDDERRLCSQTMNKLHGLYEKQKDSDQLLLLFQNKKLDELCELIAKPSDELKRIIQRGHPEMQFFPDQRDNIDELLQKQALQEPITKLGDIWKLGPHRLMCGDSSSFEDLERLMNGVQPDMIITSPPYDNLRTYQDNISKFDFEKTAFELFNIIKEGAALIWIVGDETIDGDETGTSFKQALHFKEIGFKLHDTMIWSKGSTRYPANNRYDQSFEYMFVLVKGKLKTFNPIKDRENSSAGRPIPSSSRANKLEIQVSYMKPGQFTAPYGQRYNVWYFHVGNTNVEKEPTEELKKLAIQHPAVFPIPLIQDHIKSWTNPDDLILDPFCGSGTTIIAAEQSQRYCYGMEINPRYCDVIVARYKALTNTEPRLMTQ